MAEASIRLRSQEEARALFGPQDEYLRKVAAPPLRRASCCEEMKFGCSEVDHRLATAVRFSPNGRM